MQQHRRQKQRGKNSMIVVQNMIFITGIIGFVLTFCLSGLGSQLYLHRVFSYNRKKNLREVYRLIGVETVCVSGFLYLIYMIFVLFGLLNPMGFWGILVIVLMTLLANLFVHGYAPILRGMEVIFAVLIGCFPTFFFIIVHLVHFHTNLYLKQIAVILLIINLCVWKINDRMWKNADFI